MKRIFVSSTFRDMQYERDLFHTVITPKLNGYAREYGESVSFCDLRWGVNTSELESEEGARKVLSVCLNEIDRCKPYMVVLLGDRYGWVPNKKLIKDAANKKHFYIDDLERSVTALEIEYGALRDESQLSRTLFYFREFENEIPAEYGSSDEDDALRLKELKERIVRIAGDRVRTYKARVDRDGETILGLDFFADMVVHDIKEMMEDEWEEYANLPLHEKINRSQWNIAKEKAKDFIVFQEIADKLKETIINYNHEVVAGLDGSGKTTMMSYLATSLANEGNDVIPIFCGRSKELDSKEEVLQYISTQMVMRLNDGLVSEDLYKSSTPKEDHLREQDYQKFIFELQSRVFSRIQIYDRTHKRPLYILMDDADKLDLELTYNKDVIGASIYHVDHSVHICSFFNENNLKNFNSSWSPFRLGTIVENERESVIKGLISSSGKELSPKVIRLIALKYGSSSPKYINTVLRRLEIMDKTDFDIINAYGDGNDAIIERQIELIQGIPEEYNQFFVAFMIETAKYFGGASLLDALEYLAIFKKGLNEDFWREWMQALGITVNSLDLSLYINYAQNLIDVFDDRVIRFSSDTLRQNFIGRSNDILFKYAKTIDYLIAKNCFYTLEYSYDITKMLIALGRDHELLEYIIYAMRNWNRFQRKSIAMGIHDSADLDLLEGKLSAWIIKSSRANCEALIDLVYFINENLDSIFGNKERITKKNIIFLGIKEISAYGEKEQGLYGMQILSECYKTIGHELRQEIVDCRPVIWNKTIAEEWMDKQVKVIDFYRKAVELDKNVILKGFTSSRAYWFYRAISLLISYQLDLFDRYNQYLVEKTNDMLDEASNLLDQYFFLVEPHYADEDNESILKDLKGAYGDARRIYKLKKDYQKVVIYAEKEFEILEKIEPNYHYNNINSLLTSYLSIGLIDENFERIFELFDQRVDHINEMLLVALDTSKFDKYASYLLECQSIVSCYKDNQSVLFKYPHFLESFEGVMMNFTKALKVINQIDKDWEIENTGFDCFWRIKNICNDAICVYSDASDYDKTIDICKELYDIMKYEYERFESQKTKPDFTHLVDAHQIFAKQLAKGDIKEKIQAIALLEECLSFIESNKRHQRIGRYGDATNWTTQALVDIYINMGEAEYLTKAIVQCDKAISILSSLSDNALPRIPLFKLKIKAYLLLEPDKHINQILECVDWIRDIAIENYDKTSAKLNNFTSLNNNWLSIVSLLEQAIENTNKEKHTILNQRIVEWITMCADRGIFMAQYTLGDSYYRGLHGITTDYAMAYSYYLAAAEQGHALSQYYVAAFLHIGQGVEKNNAKAVEWFKKAADNGSIDAMASLGAFYMNGIGVDKDFSQSLKYLSEACKYDHSLAQHNMAVLYWNGWGVERDYQVAISWFEKAAKNGNKEAQKTLAKIYNDGVLVTKDLVKSFEWYLKLAENNDVDAQKETGENYYYGRGVAVNYEEALRWYLKAAQNGSMLAQYSTGYCYHYGKGCTQDHAKAFEWYLKAAEQGGLSSQCEVGHAYYYGRGISQSYEKAIEWYQKSAEGGYKSGQYALAMCYKNGKGVVQDHSKSFDWFMKAAVQGSAASQNEIGEAYFYGHGVDVCYEKALEWYLKSAKNGNSSAQFNSGYCYRYGKGCEVDYVKAFEWFMRAAEQGSASAECEVGHAYYYGRGVGKSYEKAVEWYQKAADRGNKAAQYALGLCYKNGLGTDKDYTKALNGFMKAAVQGHASSQDEVGIAYYYGRGTTKDHNEAFKWFTKSAESGCSLGQYDLGVCYKNGIGTEQDYTKAFNWFMKAAVQGHAASQDNVGDAYYYGRGVESDYDKAFEWYMKSAQNGNASAQFDVGYCYKNGIGTEQDYAKAFEWFMKSADRGMAYSQCEVGYAYYFGRGVDQSYEKAAQYFLNAAQKGHAEAQKNIGTCYEEGTGVEKNLEQAIFWYQKAIEQGDENAKKALENINSKKEE